MVTLNGLGIYKGIAIGSLLIKDSDKKEVKKYQVQDCAEEIQKYEKAKENELNKRDSCYLEAAALFGEEEASIFKIHKSMITDCDFCSSVLNIIKNECLNAEYAIHETSKKFESMFSCMDDAYMRERALDVRDICESMINFLTDGETKLETGEDLIVYSKDVTPSEIALFDKNKIKGFITKKGSECSHTSILARAMKMPSVAGVSKSSKKYCIDGEFSGKKVIVDGIHGKVYIDPDEETMKKFEEKKNKLENTDKNLEKLKGKETITKCGKRIRVYANITNAEDIEESLKNDAEGIGLFRTEFLYLNRDDFPSEEEQFRVYKKAAETFCGKEVIIRTFDIGTDKKAPYFNLPEEENPAMGYRGIRVCLDRTGVFKTQLRAIFRASAFGNISLMVPMITCVEEVLKVKKIVEKVKKELFQEKVSFSQKIKLGIMIETPASVLTSDDLAKEADFFSIGTNDLTQYTLAVDRQNENVNKLYNQKHKAIFKMIEIVIKNAHKNGIWVGICGELASDKSFTEKFIEMGVDELSVASPFILSIRKKVRGIRNG